MQWIISKWKPKNIVNPLSKFFLWALVYYTGLRSTWLVKIMNDLKTGNFASCQHSQLLILFLFSATVRGKESTGYIIVPFLFLLFMHAVEMVV